MTETGTDPKTAPFETEAARRLVELLSTPRTFVLTTHEGADGDGIGSELALARVLRRRGSRVTIVNPGPTARRFQFLDRDADVNVYRSEHAAVIREADVALLVDTGELKRAGIVGEAFGTREGTVLAIDHHPRNGRSVDGLIGPDYSSTGELVTALLRRQGWELQPDVAEPLFAAILFDTQQFRFVRNDPAAFETASFLVRRGADAERVGKRLFGTVTRDYTTLLGRVLSSATFELGGRLAWAPITAETTQGLKVDKDEVRALVNVLGDVEGVEVSALFKVFQEGKVKVSLRSRGGKVINDIAESLGGGGHPFAAGADVDEDLERVMSRTLGMLRQRLGEP